MLLQGQLQAVFYMHGSVCLEKPESLQIQLDKEGDARTQREKEQPDFQTCGWCLSVLLLALPQRQERHTSVASLCLRDIFALQKRPVSSDAVSLQVWEAKPEKMGGGDAPTGVDRVSPSTVDKAGSNLIFC